MKAVLFDFGGTIDTDGVHWSEQFWAAYVKAGIEVEKKAYERAFVESDQRLLEDPAIAASTMKETLRKQVSIQFSILGLGSPRVSPIRLADACYADVERMIGKARTVLSGLQTKYSLGVVSNFYGNLEVVLKEFALDRLFGAAVDSVNVGVKKPDPEIFAIALRRLGVAPPEAWVVGDSYDRDIVPSKKLGCATIWLRGKSWSLPASTRAADHIVDKFEQIQSIL